MISLINGPPSIATRPLKIIDDCDYGFIKNKPIPLSTFEIPNTIANSALILGQLKDENKESSLFRTEFVMPTITPKQISENYYKILFRISIYKTAKKQPTHLDSKIYIIFGHQWKVRINISKKLNTVNMNLIHLSQLNPRSTTWKIFYRFHILCSNRQSGKILFKNLTDICNFCLLYTTDSKRIKSETENIENKNSRKVNYIQIGCYIADSFADLYQLKK